MKRIAIDFDNTIINKPPKGLSTIHGVFDDVIPGAVETINELYCKGYIIYIHTARQELNEVVEFLKDHGIMFNKIYHKPEADIYVDDRGLKFNGNWVDTFDEIEGFKTWR